MSESRALNVLDAYIIHYSPIYPFNQNYITCKRKRAEDVNHPLSLYGHITNGEVITQVGLGSNGKPRFSPDDYVSLLFSRDLTRKKGHEAEALIREWYELCKACPVYPVAEMVRAQRGNDLIICAPIVEESKIANPNSVKLVSIDQSKEGPEAYFQPELPENFPGCAVAQALLGIHGGETIPPTVLQNKALIG